MTIKECYEKMGADYEEVVSRIPKEQYLYKYNMKYVNTTVVDELIKGLEEKDYELAFRSVHSLKGMAMNLAYTKLFEVSNALCEELRNGEPKVDVTPMLQAVVEEHKRIIEILKEMDEQ